MTKEERKRYNQEILTYYGLGPMTPEEAEVVAALTKFEEALNEILDHEDRPSIQNNPCDQE